MTIETNTYTDKDGNEVRTYLQHGLMCPNPTQYYKMTRSYEAMRFEHDLKHPGELSDMELQLIALRMNQNKIPVLDLSLSLLPILFCLIFALIMVLSNWRF